MLEVKRSLAPAVQRGFHHACEDLRPERKIVVYPGNEAYPTDHGIEVMPLQDAAGDLRALA